MGLYLCTPNPFLAANTQIPKILYIHGAVCTKFRIPECWSSQFTVCDPTALGAIRAIRLGIVITPEDKLKQGDKVTFILKKFVFITPPFILRPAEKDLHHST